MNLQVLRQSGIALKNVVKEVTKNKYLDGKEIRKLWWPSRKKRTPENRNDKGSFSGGSLESTLYKIFPMPLPQNVMKFTLVGEFWRRKLEEDNEKAVENEDYLRYYIIKHDKVSKSVKYSHVPY